MAQTRREIEALLAAAGTRPRHRFGQNFMIDGNLVRLVAEAASPAPGDLTVEVGPGTGTLTDELLARGCEVLAVEIDRDLARLLRERLGGQARFALIEGDALSGKRALNGALAEGIASARAAGRAVKLAANLPYHVASPLLVELLRAGVATLAFTVQREVADRLRAAPGVEAYGPLSVVVQLQARVELLRTLPPQAFWPAPGVESALVRLTARGPGLHDGVGPWVQRLFAYRRKTLGTALRHMGIAGERAVGFDLTRRPDTFAPPELARLRALTSA